MANKYNHHEQGCEILASDYDKLVVARQIELRRVLAVLRQATRFNDDPNLLELITWIEQRRACLSVADAKQQ
jgi:hypothetical protein